MKKVIIIVLFFICVTGYLQVIFHIGESSRNIFSKYQNSSYKTEFVTLPNGEEVLDIHTDDVGPVRLWFNKDNICIQQQLHAFTREKYYELCDIFKISDAFKTQYTSHKKYKLKIITEGYNGWYSLLIHKI